jgi:hypothetical protein
MMNGDREVEQVALLPAVMLTARGAGRRAGTLALAVADRWASIVRDG